MGFNTAEGRAEYIALTAQVDFDFVFKIYTDEDIKAWLTPVGQGVDSSADFLTLGVDYTVSINGDNGGIFTLNTAAVAGDSITLVRSLSPSRNIEYQNNGDLRSNILNLDQDYQTYLIADGVLSISKSIRISENDILFDTELPQALGGQYLRVKEDLTGFEYIDLDTEVSESKAAAAASEASAAESASSASSAATSVTQSNLSASASEASAVESASSASSAATSATQAYQFAQGGFLTNESAYDLGFVTDEFNLFPTDLGGLV